MSKSIQLKDKNNEKYYPHPYYPVGSIYLSVNNTNPSRWFGGTWELIAQGRTLVGVDTNDTDFNTVKKTGGSKYIQNHKHTSRAVNENQRQVTTGEHASGLPMSSRTDGDNIGWSNYHTDATVGGIDNNTQTGNSGNLQPYFTCYIWCRTA